MRVLHGPRVCTGCHPDSNPSPPSRPSQVVRTLEQRRFFGLERSQVTVFRCDTRTPCFDADLKAVMRWGLMYG